MDVIGVEDMLFEQDVIQPEKQLKSKREVFR